MMKITGGLTIAILTLVFLIAISSMVYMTQPTNAYLMLPAQTFTGSEGIYLVKLTFTYPDTSTNVIDVVPANYSNGVSVPENSLLVSIYMYANISATRYTTYIQSNTWFWYTLTNPLGVNIQDYGNKVDFGYAYFDNGTLISGSYTQTYSADADYYTTFKWYYINVYMTAGTWALNIQLYLL